MSRRSFVAALVAIGVFTILSHQAAGLTNSITPGTITVKLQPFATIPGGDGEPQDLVSANDGSGRLFVATRNGKIDLLSSTGTSLGTFLDMGAAGLSIYTGGEGGFLGLAFSPTFSAPANVPGSGKFYTFTTENFGSPPVTADFTHPEIGSGGNNQTLIRSWTVSANPNLANTTSTALIRANHPQSNHQGGGLKFGPDGDLYFSIGDGGGGNDNNGSATDPTDGHTNAGSPNGGGGNGQDTTVVFGKILRIDPNGNNSANGRYGIPASNPFVGQAGKVAEIYAYGLRNPFRFPFDAATGTLLAGDVGQDNREEVDAITSGGNYGWVFREGTTNNAGYPASPPAGFSSIDPIGEYTHGDGDAIIGGFVYHGASIPALDGKYVFGDYQGTANLGRLFYMDAGGGTIRELQYNTTGDGINPPSNLVGFGQDASGEIYGLFSNGQVVKIVPEPASAALLALGSLLLARRPRRRGV